MTCTRCDSTGFLNIEQAPDGLADHGTDAVMAWLQTPDGEAADVQVCDCCGDGTGWHGEPGWHYSASDPQGPNGPYASNGGLCQCH